MTSISERLDESDAASGKPSKGADRGNRPGQRYPSMNKATMMSPAAGPAQMGCRPRPNTAAGETPAEAAHDHDGTRLGPARGDLAGVGAGMPYGVRVAAGWAWRMLLIAGLIAGIGWLVGYLSEVTIPLGVAALLCALLSPVTRRLTNWGVPGVLAVAITVLGGLALLAAALSLITTQIVAGSGGLVTSATSGFTQLTGWLHNGPLRINSSYFTTSQLTAKATQFLQHSQSSITTYAGEVGSQLGHFFAGFAITIFALFYFLLDGRGIWTFLLRFFPQRKRAGVDRAALNGWEAVGHYVRATIVVALVDAAGVLLIAEILRVPLAPALAALVFLGAFIPLVGAFVSGFLAVVVALVALGWIQALIMLAGIVVVMEVEGHILQPFLLGRAVKLHPLAVLLAITIGVVVAGVVGALVSVPILAFANSFVQSSPARTAARRRRSPTQLGEASTTG